MTDDDSQRIGIAIRILVIDDGLLVRLAARSARFAGSTRLYIDVSRIASLAEALRGFPKFVDDQREVELGTFDDRYAGGARD